MQQYFLNQKLHLNLEVELTNEILHHLKTVLRSNDGYEFCLVDVSHQAFLAELFNGHAKIIKKLDVDCELDIDVTVILSLIKNERFDFCLQKLTELGVKRIVPLMAHRSIIKVKDEEKKLSRYQKIVTEAAEQSRRLYVPKIEAFAKIDDLEKYKSDYNYVAYEKNFDKQIDYRLIDRDFTYVIGPEGGFEEYEIAKLLAMGFKTMSLGKRILRAETAAIYVMANLGGNQR